MIVQFHVQLTNNTVPPNGILVATDHSIVLPVRLRVGSLDAFELNTSYAVYHIIFSDVSVPSTFLTWDSLLLVLQLSR